VRPSNSEKHAASHERAHLNDQTACRGSLPPINQHAPHRTPTSMGTTKKMVSTKARRTRPTPSNTPPAIHCFRSLFSIIAPVCVSLSLSLVLAGANETRALPPVETPLLPQHQFGQLNFCRWLFFLFHGCAQDNENMSLDGSDRKRKRMRTDALTTNHTYTHTHTQAYTHTYTQTHTYTCKMPPMRSTKKNTECMQNRETTGYDGTRTNKLHAILNSR
jgi:hypothetical protein